MLAFFRFLAAVFLLIAVLAGVYDGTRTLAADRLVTTSLLEHWSTLAPTLLNTTQSAVKRSAHPLVWDMGLGKTLLLPASLVFFAIGVLFAYVGRRRRRRQRLRQLTRGYRPAAGAVEPTVANEVRGAVKTSMAMPPTTRTAITTTRYFMARA